MSRFLLIAVYGSTIAIALAFTFAEYGNEGKTTVRKKYMDDFEPQFEDALSDLNWNVEHDSFYKNEPEANIDDEKDDNESEESDVLDLEKRSPDPKLRKGRPGGFLRRPGGRSGGRPGGRSGGLPGGRSGGRPGRGRRGRGKRGRRRRPAVRPPLRNHGGVRRGGRKGKRKSNN